MNILNSFVFVYMIIQMVRAIAGNQKLKTISKETILNFLDIINNSVGIKTRFLINATNY